MPRALVTGGAGFIGPHLARALQGTHDVTVLDDLSGGGPERVPPEADFVRGSVLDADALASAVRGADAVFHLAAMTSVAQCQADPAACQRVNADGTRRVAAASLAAGVRKLVLASTCAVYGDATPPPVPETAAVAPLGPYAASKWAAEAEVRAAATLGLAATVVRYFNVYGPGQDPRSQYAAVVPRFLDLARRGAPLPLHGGGAQTRDFVHVSDVVRATLAAASSGPADGATVNIGSGRPTAVRDLARLVVRATGSRSVLQDAPARPGEVEHSHADVRLARRVLGFEAAVPLEQGLVALARGA
jgi:UDP-glucose 4-epimerase